MGVPSIIVQRSFDDAALVTPAVNEYAFKGYLKYKITKSGYLWGYIRIALIEGLAGKLKEENLGLIGTGLLLETVTDEGIMFKKPKRGRVLYREFERNAEGQWNGIASTKH